MRIVNIIYRAIVDAVEAGDYGSGVTHKLSSMITTQVMTLIEYDPIAKTVLVISEQEWTFHVIKSLNIYDDLHSSSYFDKLSYAMNLAQLIVFHIMRAAKAEC